VALAFLAAVVSACSGGEGSPIISAPTTALTPAPAVGAATPITASLLRSVDVPGGAPSAAGSGVPPFVPPAPCGSRFPNTDGSIAQATITFASTGTGSSVDETVARYPGPAAARLATDFRDRAAKCSSPAPAQGSFQVRTLTPPPVGDDAAAIALAGTGPSADLVVVRYGSVLAWLVFYRATGSIDATTRDGVITRAANRLAGL
jgi:hypothetical protein